MKDPTYQKIYEEQIVEAGKRKITPGEVIAAKKEIEKLVKRVFPAGITYDDFRNTLLNRSEFYNDEKLFLPKKKWRNTSKSGKGWVDSHKQGPPRNPYGEVM